MTRNARGTGAQPPNGATPRTTDLYSRAPDGKPVLWKTAVPVMPVTMFERDGHGINSGHYVIDHHGDPIVVHCANMDGEDDSVSVHFMHGEQTSFVLPRKIVESMLLGKVVVSRDQPGAVFRQRRLSDYFTNHAPPVIAARPTLPPKPKQPE